MFEKNLKSTTIQMRVTEDEKELIRLMASRSPQQDITPWLMSLVAEEYKRIKEFDSIIANFGK